MLKNYSINGILLDKYQLQLLNENGNTLVVAGAGAGKTLTILGKINYLIETKEVIPENILVISFTNASVNDIKKKINYNINVFTFHKLAMTILEKANYNYNLCNDSILSYIIQEEIIICSKEMKKNILKFLNISSDFDTFCQSKKFKSFCQLIENYINLWKTNNLLLKDIDFKKYSNLEKKILYFIFKIYSKYIHEKRSIQALDFDDLIFEATKNIKNISLKYEYIIIDEFQDTSLIRLNLIKEIYNYTNSKIIVVGDDWQSIYRFSGCDLNIFLNFNNYFFPSKTIKLVNTYRNSQELINIASKFITKNSYQIIKTLKSNKTSKTPFVLVPYFNKKEKLKQVLDDIIKVSNDIMILARNNKDIYEYIDDNFKYLNNTIEYKETSIKYYTVHKSKGLEAEYVVILNCNNEVLGFPNQIEDNAILRKLYPNKEIPFAEERRLFYVAITRCKEKTYLLYNKDKPSIFIMEIKKLIKKQLHHIEYFKK